MVKVVSEYSTWIKEEPEFPTPIERVKLSSLTRVDNGIPTPVTSIGTPTQGYLVLLVPVR